jgi:hypothetical protein
LHDPTALEKVPPKASADQGLPYPEALAPGGGDLTNPRFPTTNGPIAAIAVCSGQNDAGVFELFFVSDRYMPFEGAGAISSWRLELPDARLPSFDCGTIADVVVHMCYTALNGGRALRGEAFGSVM